MVNGLLKNHLVIDENDLNAVKRFKEVATQEIQKRFDIKEAIENQGLAVITTILDCRYHLLKFLTEGVKARAYSAVKEKLLFEMPL